MNKMVIAVLATAGMLSVFDTAEAQVAGSTKVGVSVTELRQVAFYLPRNGYSCWPTKPLGM